MFGEENEGNSHARFPIKLNTKYLFGFLIEKNQANFLCLFKRGQNIFNDRLYFKICLIKKLN